MTTARRPSSFALIVAFALVYVCWGTTYLALKIGVREEKWPPALFGGVRVCVAGLILLGWQTLRGQQLWLPRRDYGPLAVCAVLLFVGGNGLINVAGQTLDSGLCAVLAATTPLWIGLLGFLWPGGDRLSARGWVGLLVGPVGVLLLFASQMDPSREGTFDAGMLCVLGSAACWAVGSLVGRHWRIGGSHLTGAAYQMILGGGCLALVGVACGELTRVPDHVSARSVGAALWLLVVGSLLGFVAYNWLLAHVSAAQAGTYAYVNPAIAVLVGLLHGEEATAGLVGGIFIILVGVALVRAGSRPLDAEIAPEPDPCPVELCRKEVSP
jgi:drug/metabolite transporter (DMT)-like permease